ncbi:MAG: hypothetical protein H7252_06290 [Cytophaga sp.]|nr:hypothetical protein [Undibacterium sp.]
MLGWNSNLLFYIPFIVLLSACADSPKKITDFQISPSLDSMLAKASAVSNAGQSEQALSQLKSATASFPADKKPWLQMAQINFDGANYGDAINNALEVLQRDPSDKVANSIVVVSGLRLSTKALADLSQQNNLSGSVRTEAQDLAKLLRESLGESILIPPVRKLASNLNKQTSASLAPSMAGASGAILRPTTSKNEVVPTKVLSTETKKSDGNPFGSLK